ncbi:hypothetical protein EVAR_17513_1 [Eumeta japonica]|uniref:Uncharacterized protein n=1 Tax=Eumeta variegata TaxID=151549 RepID=A0A4C1WPX9_EUMVA|nr:hypothetical protein EVAR_17513_1 [Eumeta japonica]
MYAARAALAHAAGLVSAKRSSRQSTSFYIVLLNFTCGRISGGRPASFQNIDTIYRRTQSGSGGAGNARIRSRLRLCMCTLARDATSSLAAHFAPLVRPKALLAQINAPPPRRRGWGDYYTPTVFCQLTSP